MTDKRTLNNLDENNDFDETNNIQPESCRESPELSGDEQEMNLEDEENVSSEEERTMVLQAELEQAQAKAEEYYAHLQRLQAEFDNYRKRTSREKEELAKYASERLVETLLPILDNFERATAAAQSSQDLPTYARGVEMILRQLQDVLGKEGLTPIECVGEPFDPQCHEAVLQVDMEGYPENTVVEELQKGYYLKDKVLRPSMVKVSR